MWKVSEDNISETIKLEIHDFEFQFFPCLNLFRRDKISTYMFSKNNMAISLLMLLQYF